MRKKLSVLMIVYVLISIPLYTLIYNNINSKVVPQIIYFIITVAYTVIVHRIIIYKKYINEELEKQMLYGILDDTETMILSWCNDEDSVNVNDCFITKTRIDPLKTSGNKILTTIFAGELNNIYLTLTKQKSYQLITTLERKNKSTITVMWKITNSSQDKEKPQYMAVGVDITKTIRMESEITTFQQQLKLSTDLAEIGLIYRLITSDKYIISENLREKLGFDCTEVTTTEFCSKIHPDDIATYMKSLKINNSEIHETSSKIKELHLRFFCIDKDYHWYCLRYKVTPEVVSDDDVLGGCMYDISRDKEKDAMIEKMAFIDDVTQISNRNHIMTIGPKVLDCIKHTHAVYYMLVFDIDKFHIINNICGYDKGDFVLKSIAIKILQNMTDDSHCARLGGDSFAVLISQNDCKNNIENYIAQVQSDISSIQDNMFKNVTITTSCGYYEIKGDCVNFADILEHAEFAARMSHVRNDIIPYTSIEKEKIITTEQLEKQIEKALDNNELVVYYQPKIDLQKQTISGAEALIRWIKKDGTIIPPASFIPVAESSMLITKISKFVLKQTCKQIKLWENKIQDDFSISINLTSVDFYQTDVCRIIKEAINESGINPKHLEIELTEGIAVKDIDHAVSQMNELNTLGIKVSLDDFGTGYSSLSYIKVLPISLLKLDRSFIINMEKDDVSRQIVYSVINICKSKKVKIVAEGIETKNQAELLKSCGCDIAQGYLYGKPMPSNMMEEYIDNNIKKPVCV